MDGTDFIVSSGWGIPAPFWLMLVAGASLVLFLPAWYIFGSILALRESTVDKPNRIAQLYGYTVCLITLLVILYSVSSILDSAFTRANPLQSDPPFGVSLTSFEAYKAKRTTFPAYGREEAVLPDTASDATLRARYDVLVADRLGQVRYDTTKAFVTNGALLIITLGLFLFHWRWVRRLNGGPSAAG